MELEALNIEPQSEDVANLLQSARIELARRYAKKKQILQWGKIMFPDKFPLPFCHELHDYFISIRHEEHSNTEAPRNHAKTTIKCFLIPIFQMLEEPDMFKHYLNVQATGAKAMEINRSIKAEIETNPNIFLIYGNVIGERWTDQQFVIAHRDKKTRRVSHSVACTSIGAGQSIRGINYRNIRPDYIIVDDLYDEEDINNPDSTIKKNEWFWGSLYPARAKSRRCSVHVQGTAINDEDLLDKLKKHEGWKNNTFRAIKDNGDVLWKELNTKEKLDTERADMGSIIFDRELQNIRRNDATSIIKKTYLTNWEYDPEMFFHRMQMEPDKFFIMAVIMGNDPSIGKDTDDDDTGTALVYKTGTKDSGGNDYWIQDLRMERLTLEGRKDQLVEMSKMVPKEHALTTVNIEAIAGFDDYATYVISQTNLPIHRIEFVKDKISTLTNKSHFFENGKVHLNKNLPEAVKDKIVYQLTTNHPRHDDGRDAVLLCLEDNAGLWGFVE